MQQVNLVMKADTFNQVLKNHWHLLLILHF